MDFAHVNTYPAAPAAVLAMLTDPAFRTRVCEAQHALDHDVRVDGSAPLTTVVVRRTQSMAGAPKIATRVTGDAVEIVQTETWGSDTADFSMEIPGKPGSLRGAIALRETAEGTEEVFTGQVQVSIPLVGGKLEGFISDLLARALRREGQVGRDWLTGR